MRLEMKSRFLAVLAIGAAAAACGGGSSDDSQPAPVSPLPPGHPTTEDTSPKEGPRLMPAETYIRSYLQIFGGLAPLAAQTALQAKDGVALFDTWDDYLGTLGMPDYRYDTPRTAQTNTLMVATFERVGIALCDRALEHDKSTSPRLVYDFDMPEKLDAAGFAQRFDVVHRTFLGYPAALAPTPRTDRYHKLYTDTIALHASVSSSRFSPAEAGWAAVCYGLVRHPEFHLY